MTERLWFKIGRDHVGHKLGSGGAWRVEHPQGANQWGPLSDREPKAKREREHSAVRCAMGG